MKHLPIIRLVKIAGDSTSTSEDEEQHLKSCAHCTLILQRFIADHLKQIEGKGDRKEPQTGKI